MKKLLVNGKNFMFNYWYLIVIFVFYLFIHIYKINCVPYGMHIDEAGMAYDALNLSKYGFDKYLNSYPLYLINYGGGQSVLYCYLCALFLKILPFSIFTIRIPAIINAILIFIYGSLTIYLIFKSKISVLIYTILITIMPYFIMGTRFGLDCNLMLGFSIMFLYYLLKAISTKKTIYYIASGIAGGIVLYTYALSYFIMPIFILLVLIYLIYTKNFNLKKVILFLIPLFLLALPLIIIQIINMFDLEQIKIFKFTLTKLRFYRSNELSIFNFFNNIIPLLKSVFLYDWLPYNTLPKYGTIYYISIIFFIIGFIHSSYWLIINILNKKYKEKNIIIIWFLVTFFLGGILGGDGPNANKLNCIFFSVVVFVVDFFMILYYSKNKLSKIFILIISINYLILFSSFFHFYYYEYNDKYNPQIMFTPLPTDVIDYIENSKKLKQTPVYFDGSGIYLFCDLKVPVYKLNKYSWSVNYDNYKYKLPEEVDLAANYIVNNNNKEYINKLKHLSNYKYIKFKDYYLFYK